MPKLSLTNKCSPTIASPCASGDSPGLSDLVRMRASDKRSTNTFANVKPVGTNLFKHSLRADVLG